MSAHTARRIHHLTLPVLVLLVILAVWELSVWLTGVSILIVPSPHDVAKAWVENAATITAETGITMLEAAAGFTLGSMLAYITAIVFTQSTWMEKALMPFAVALKSTPLIALAPVLVLWYGNGFVSKVVMSALVAFFPVLVAGLRGLRAVDPDTLDMMRSLGASQLQILCKIRVPSSLGYVFAALKVASSLAVVGAVIGEMVGSTRGIGHLLNVNSYYLETPLVFAAIFSISVSSVAFFGLIAAVESRIVFWETKDL